MTNLRSAQQGQTLLIVIFAMSLGLLVIVNTAGRTLSSVARTTQTNFYQKATAVAEGGAEVFLAKPITDYPALTSTCAISKLADLATVDGASCTIPFTESKAYLGVEAYPVSLAKESLNIKSQPGETIHINLNDLNFDADFIQVCWKGLGIKDYSASHYFYYHGLIGDYEVDKDLLTCNTSFTAWCKNLGGNVGNVSQAVANGDYSCYSINVQSDSVALRIFTFPDGAEYTIEAYKLVAGNPVKTTFPQQGYRIISIGEVTGAGGTSLMSKKATRKKLTVEKTFPYPAGPWWDFAVTSINGMVSP